MSKKRVREPKEERLKRLFEFYSADLTKFAPKLKGIFGCPLCHRTIASSPKLSDVVSEVHVIPEALGGRIITLTCRKCNNEGGKDLDSHMIQRVRVEARKQPLRTRMYVGHGEQGAELHLPK